MNKNLILLSTLLIKNKLSILFNYDNYYFKLLCILYFNHLYLYINNNKFNIK
jgi:hypothetical protein